MGANSRSSRADGARPNGQHFLRSRLIAAELVRDAGVSSDEHVLEIGAGRGRLTQPLAERAGRVTAVEIDPVLAERLRRAFDRRQHVRIVVDDILRAPFPEEPFRAFGNIPFALTTPILRRLLDRPSCPLTRADLLIQFEAARKRGAVYPATLLSLGWLPWWELTLVRRIPRSGFEPVPSVDAGLLVITRRQPALLAPRERPSYVALLRRAFDSGSWPIRRSLRDDLPPVTWKRIARERGIAVDALPASLDVWDWVEVYTTFKGASGADETWRARR